MLALLLLSIGTSTGIFFLGVLGKLLCRKCRGKIGELDLVLTLDLSLLGLTASLTALVAFQFYGPIVFPWATVEGNSPWAAAFAAILLIQFCTFIGSAALEGELRKSEDAGRYDDFANANTWLKLLRHGYRNAPGLASIVAIVIPMLVGR